MQAVMKVERNARIRILFTKQEGILFSLPLNISYKQYYKVPYSNQCYSIVAERKEKMMGGPGRVVCYSMKEQRAAALILCTTVRSFG